ncbi:hypothetical protein D9758_016184 [Tetrapyrgos nigripes]|uniref:CCHC-type domain-containing protein n=1 Tax=Tetrapyrgos nigripes TaxID=182062 RepID=A0A8H5C4L2_9AGAR|nr:hypothetical protein D9758_016184 [Tetrapyrgos nigripes]
MASGTRYNLRSAVKATAEADNLDTRESSSPSTVTDLSSSISNPNSPTVLPSASAPAPVGGICDERVAAKSFRDAAAFSATAMGILPADGARQSAEFASQQAAAAVGNPVVTGTSITNTVPLAQENRFSVPGSFDTPELITDDDGGSWTTVVRRRSRRTRSLEDLRSGDISTEYVDSPSKRGLSTEQAAAISAAERSMTAEQLAAVNARNEKVKVFRDLPVREDTISSEKENIEPSYVRKGKFVDKNNEITDDELDLEKQRQAILEWNQMRDAALENERSKKATPKNVQVKEPESVSSDSSEVVVRKKRHHKRAKKSSKDKKVRKEPMSYQRKVDKLTRGDLKSKSKDIHKRDVTPMNQLPGNSRLARLLGNEKSKSKTNRSRKQKKKSSKKNSRKRHTRKRPSSSDEDSSDSSSGSDDESESSDSSSSSSSESEESSSSTSTDVSDHSSSSSDSSSDSSDSDSSDSSSSSSSSDDQRKKKKRKYSKKRRGSREASASLLKNLAPTIYDGTPDLERFEAFVMEASEWIKAGKVPENQQCYVVSRRLSGIAERWFWQKIGAEHSKWELGDLYAEMFNYCFPLDLSDQQRAKLREFCQGSKRVIEYVHELTLLLNLTGGARRRDRVIKLWDGLRPEIQMELRRKDFDKMVHKWDEIVKAAERIEIAYLEQRRNRAKKAQDDNGKPSGLAKPEGRKKSGKPNFRGRWRKENNNSPPNPVPMSSSSATFNGTQKPHNNPGAGGRKPPNQNKRTPGNYSEAFHKKKAEMKAKDLCFKCGNPGHFERNCPENNTVRANRRGPPGRFSNNIASSSARFELKSEESAGLDSTTQPGLSISMMSFELFDSPTDESSEPAESIDDTFSWNSDRTEMPTLQEVSDSEDEYMSDDMSSDNSEASFEDLGLEVVSMDTRSDASEDEEWLGPEYLSEYIREYLPVPDPAIGNFAREYNPEEEWLTCNDGRLMYSWASEAKEVFGYPDTDYSNFFLHGKIDSEWRVDEVGDMIAAAARHILHHFAPYPGDEYRWGSHQSDRIQVYRYSDEFYSIDDIESEQGVTLVPIHLLLNEKFQLASWYAKARAKQQALPYDKAKWSSRDNSIGDVFANGLRFWLSLGEHRYPENEDTEIVPISLRFQVCQYYGNPEKYSIFDNVEGIFGDITREKILDPRFNAIEWWMNVLREENESRQLIIDEWERKDEIRRFRERRKQERHDQTHLWMAQRQNDPLARALEENIQNSPPFFLNGKPSPFAQITAWTTKDGQRVEFIDHEVSLEWAFTRENLLIPEFCPGKIWAMARQDIEDLDISVLNFDYPAMGDALADAAADKLRCWVHVDGEFPRTNSDEQYLVYRHPSRQDVYTIEDTVREFKVDVAKGQLLNKWFNLPEWYKKRVRRAEEALINSLKGPIEYEFLPSIQTHTYTF